MKLKLNAGQFLLGLGAGLWLLGTGCATDTSSPSPLSTSSEVQLDAAATRALQNLYSINPTAKSLALQAKAVLVFPDVLKGGFMFGGELGNGVLRQNGHTTGYYNLSVASYGFQAGLQNFSYVMFRMNDSALDYLRQTGGWAIGTGPSLVILDEGMARTVSTTTARQDVYGRGIPLA